MRKRKLTRSQLRRLLLHEAKTLMPNRRPINEGILGGLAVGALVTLALAALTGVQYVVFETIVDDLIASDPRVKAKLAELENLIKENPDKHPGEIARMSVQTDAELAKIIDEIETQAMERMASGMSNTSLDF